MTDVKNQRGEDRQPLSIHDLLEIQAERKPDAVAVKGLNGPALTFTRLLLQTEEAVRPLNLLGISRNDRIAVVLRNGPEMAVSFLAIAAAYTCAPLNPACRDEEFDFYLSDLKAKALIVEAGTDSPARAVASRRSIPIIELSPRRVSATGLFTLRCGNGTVACQDSFAQADDTALILYTSGTTSRPMMVPLTHHNLLTSAINIAASLRLTEEDRCLNIMPLFHIHGLIGAVLSSLAAGSSVICAPEFSAPQFLDWLEEFHPTWYTAVPTMHQAIVKRAEETHRTIGRSSLRLIRSCSAPLPPKVAAGLEGLFRVPVIEAYGMTEASHQITSSPLPPHPRKTSSVGVATGTEIAIMNESGEFLPSGQTGEIVIRGANITGGYLYNPAANLSAFVRGWFRTGDLGYQDQEGYLFITGRLKEMINRGGEKVSPAEVDEVLLDHPAVSQAVTFALPDASLGEEVAAAVVLSKDGYATEREIQEFLALRLAEHKIPRRVVFVDEIPKGATGKLQRVELAEKLGLAALDATEASPKPPFVAPRTPIEEALANIWCQVLRVEAVGLHDDFFGLGGDSVLAAQVIARVRQTLQLELSFVDFWERATIAGIAAGIQAVGCAEEQLSVSSITPAVGGNQLPLSFAQQRLWFFDQLEPGTPAYNRPVFLRLSGRLDTMALQRSLNEIVRRHEILRTTFRSAAGRPYQVISPALQRAMPVVDLSLLQTNEREAEARRLAIDEGNRAFDLTADTLLRARLLRLGDDEHILILTTHHIASDGWSDGILFQELAALYEAFSRGQPSPLNELSVQYADFATWQQQWLADDVLDAQLAYWRRKLAGASPTLELFTDRPRPASESFQAARQSILLPTSLTDGLKALSRRERVTLFMTLLAAFKVLLWRYTAQDDIVVGTPFAGRNRVETEKLIGVFTNTVVLRTDLSGNPSFHELLSRVRETSLEAHAHQDVPFERLVEELQPERVIGRNPLFQVMFQLRSMPVEAARLSGMKVARLDFACDVAKLDLLLEIVENPDTLTCRLYYRTDLFDAATIARMAGHYHTLLQSIVANTDQRISHLSLLSESERRQLLVEWNDTRREYRKDKCVHELFEAHVERTPDAVAVRFQEQRLTYRELNEQANRLARYLRNAGVGPDVPVGLCVERSAQMVVGLLAILKAGGAYVPLDAGYPPERLRFMLEDTAAPVVLTQQQLAQSLPAGGAKHVLIDRDWQQIAREREDNPGFQISPENLAYVTYTSGSTGKPKGVEISHRAVSRLLTGADYTDFGSSEVFLQLAPMSFDASTFELWGALAHGAQCVLFPGTPSAPDELAGVLGKYGVTTLWLTASLFNTVIDQAPEALSGVRQLLTGGETLSVEHVQRALAALPNTRISNGYGPTESTTFACCHPIPRRLDGAVRSIPIGRSIANTSIFILDSTLNPVPIGVTGEIYIGGDGLARGYLNRPELTAEKFIPHPFSDEPGARLYKTGDLGRYRLDGNIEFSGRIDHQVKIRGFRIEPGEIEAALREHPDIREAAVVARADITEGPYASENRKSDKRLVAYVVSKENRVSSSELRSFLNDKLPDYMLPSTFVTLNVLPLTPNGKLDRRALPAPGRNRSDLSEIFVTPRTMTEQVIADIWSEVFDVEPIGVHDNFFELGLHSLLAMQVISRLRDAFDVHLPLRALFENPTIASLAEWIDAACRPPKNTNPPALRSRNREKR
jgi:amino acid adenylation domain-containing protein